MKILLTITACIIMAINANSQFSDYRKVYLFGVSANKALAGQQQQLFDSARAGMKERDLLVTIEENNPAMVKKYKVDNDVFTVILIGKDGGEKHRTHQVLQPQKLFGIIDAMPMRRAEMRRQ